MTTEQPRDVAAEFMAATAAAASRAGGTAPLTQNAEPSGDGAAPQEGARQPVFAPWGAVADPHEAIRVFEANPQTREALLDSGHALHSSALKRRSELYAAAHGDERGDTIAGDGSGLMSPAIHEGYQEPTEAEMRAQVTNTATGILERNGVDAESAKGIAQIAIASGLNSVDVSTVAESINGRQYSSPEQVRAELGADAERLIAAAQAEADRLKLPGELLNMEVGGIVLGEHPSVIRQLARRAGVR